MYDGNKKDCMTIILMCSILVPLMMMIIILVLVPVSTLVFEGA